MELGNRMGHFDSTNPFSFLAIIKLEKRSISAMGHFAMERLLRALPARPESYVIRYAFTAGLVAFCYGLVWTVPGEPASHGFFIFYVAIFLASVLFDHGSGFFATALAAVVMAFEMKPPGSTGLSDDSIVMLILFVVISIGVAFASEGLRKAWERAVAAEQVKDLLLQELRHRTKNDLAMVISVLSVQARADANPDTKDALEKAMARIRAIAGAHDQFGTLNDAARIDIKAYLTQLCNHLADGVRGVRPVTIEVDVEPAAYKTKDAVPLGLIVNELVTNALKYAFADGRTGVVRVTLKGAAPRVLLVEDNGVGLPDTPRPGIGSRLIELLVKQLGGSIAWETGDPGCRVRVALAPPR